jgi:Methyltransferase domain
VPRVPPNVQFEIDDIEEEWTFSKPFDFIHARYLAGSVRDWKKLASQCFKYLTLIGTLCFYRAYFLRHLKPGGWVEFKDWDTRAHDSTGSRDIRDNYVKLWHDEVIGACNDLGVTPYPALIIKDVATDAGFTNLHERIFPVPVGAWPKDKKLKLIGKFYEITVDEGAPAMSLRLLTQTRNWSVEEVHALNARFRKDMKSYPFYHK